MAVTFELKIAELWSLLCCCVNEDQIINTIFLTDFCFNVFFFWSEFSRQLNNHEYQLTINNLVVVVLLVPNKYCLVDFPSVILFC